MHLLDTELVWALRKARQPGGDPAVAAWAEEQARAGLFVSALTLTELDTAATRAERADRNAAAAIRRWIDGPVMTAFDGRILPVDAAIARRAGSLAYSNLRDAMFAATALEHGLTLATRTPAAYRLGKVRTVNPWTYAPHAPNEDADWRQASRPAPVWLKSLFARG